MTLDVKLSPDGGMVKISVCEGLASRAVWFGVGRVYRVEPLFGTLAKQREGRLGVLVSFDVDRPTSMRFRWVDTGRVGLGDPRHMVEVPERIGKIAPGKGGRCKSPLARSRSEDRADRDVTDSVVSNVASEGRSSEGRIARIEARAGRRPVCEVCEDVHVNARWQRTCQWCWSKLGKPDMDWLTDHLNGLAFERHQQALTEVKVKGATPW